jgi:predicted phosphodiesterase
MIFNVIVLSDVHCDWNRVEQVCNLYPNDTVLQLGDLGIGFLRTEFVRENTPKNFRFFVGNHDNRSVANTLPACLGDFGEFEDIFFVSGARSVDRFNRIEGKSWWPDEELSYSQATACLDAWLRSDKDIIVSHDTTQSFVERFMLIYDRSITRSLLQSMVDARKPKMIIFGHHHRRYEIDHDDVQYRCLPINGTFIIDSD